MARLQKQAHSIEAVPQLGPYVRKQFADFAKLGFRINGERCRRLRCSGNS